MKILHLRASNFYGGPERQLHLHARRALGTDYEVTVASFHENGEPAKFLAPVVADDIPTHSFAVRSAYDLTAVRMLRDYVRDQAVDVLCTHEYRSTSIGRLAVRGTDAKWIAFSRGFTTENLKVRAFQWLERLLIRQADLIVAVSRSQKHKLERLRIDPDLVAVVPNAVDPEFFENAEAVDLRSRFGFRPDQFVAVAGGRFSSEKGQAYLVEAAAEAMREESRLRLVMFGEGPERKPILRRIAALGLEDQVLCPGFEKNMVGCIRAADLLVNPSLSEGMPNIVLEAMALSTPVLATAVGGVPELIEDGETGRLVRPGSASDLATGLVEAARNRDRMRRMTERAFEVARQDLGFGRQLERLSAIYRQVVSANE